MEAQEIDTIFSKQGGVSKEAIEFYEALELAEPLLTRYIPEGWTDFRDPMPSAWRMGLFVGRKESFHEFKAMLGSEHAARFVAANLQACIGFFHSAPVVYSPTIPRGNWTVFFAINDCDLVPLTECLRPKMETTNGL
jgi:hypothetical protein